jgi:cytoskeletal protein RodZ
MKKGTKCSIHTCDSTVPFFSFSLFEFHVARRRIWLKVMCVFFFFFIRAHKEKTKAQTGVQPKKRKPEKEPSLEEEEEEEEEEEIQALSESSSDESSDSSDSSEEEEAAMIEDSPVIQTLVLALVLNFSYFSHFVGAERRSTAWRT